MRIIELENRCTGNRGFESHPLRSMSLLHKGLRGLPILHYPLHHPLQPAGSRKQLKAGSRPRNCYNRGRGQSNEHIAASTPLPDGRMTNSTVIARLMGPVLLFMGIGAVIGLLGRFPEGYVGVLREINNQSATLILGMFALLAGLAIVNVHNLWVSDWRVIITILGWLAIVRGALSLLFPNKMYGIGETILASRSGTMSGAVIVLVLGGILSWMGYRVSKSEAPGR